MLSASAAGCMGGGDDTVSAAAAVSSDAGAPDVSADVVQESATVTAASADHAEPSAAPPPVAGIRVANWSPDAPAIDLCVAPHGTTAFRGPMLGSLVGQGDDAGVAALPFPYASAYSYVSPGQYDARLVVAGASNCAAGIGADVTNLPALDADGYATIALIGDANPAAGAPGLQLVGFPDDAYASSGAALRFINAAPVASLALADFGELSDTKFVPLFLAVHFGQASNAPEAMVADAASGPVDPNGYTSIGALSDATLSLRARNGATDLAVANNVNIAAGAIVTVVAVGPSELVECVDNAGTLSYLGACGVISGGGDAGGL
jgi:hypothetical protein